MEKYTAIMFFSKRSVREKSQREKLPNAASGDLSNIRSFYQNRRFALKILTKILTRG